MPEKITLRGKKEGLTVEFSASKHVRLSDGYYEKSDSENVVNVNGRYYRRNSPLICELSSKYYGPDSFGLIEECRKDSIYRENIYSCDSTLVPREDFIISSNGDISNGGSDGSVHYRTARNTIRVSDSSGRAIDSVIWGDTGSQIDKGVLVRSNTGVLFFAKDIIPMHPSYRGQTVSYIGLRYTKKSGERVYVRSIKEAEDNNVIINAKGGYHLYGDIEWSRDQSGNNYKPIANRVTGFIIDERHNPYSLSKGLNSKTRSLMSAIAAQDSVPSGTLNELLKSSWFEETRLDSDFSTESYHTMFGFYVGIKGDAIIINDLYKKISSISSIEKTSSKIASNLWFGEHHSEPIPELYTRNSIGNQGGDYVYSLGKSNRIGNTYSKTGSIGYTFGVELETEFGVTPLEVARSLPVDCVGDRSVGSLEYVTGVLSGDSGIDALMHIAGTVSKYSMVADTCGVHVHIGGNSKDWQPRFDKEFSVLAVMLGVLIEDELFSLMPSNRRDKKNSNGQSYCASIKNYSGINLKNWKKQLFEYVYGRGPEDPSEEFGDLKSLIEKRHHVGRWGVGRYKWLNLVNCLTDNSGRRNGGGFQTIEFRAFNGTLNPSDLRAFVLISLAFVRFIELNRESIPSIKKISISDIISSTMDSDTFNWFTSWMMSKKNQIAIVNASLKEKVKEENNTI